MSPLARATARDAVVAIATVAIAGVLGASVRLLPWLLAKTVPLRVALPFARGLLSLALEVAMVVGLPIGWSLGAYRVWERGEARVFALLGERPAHTLRSLIPQGGAFVLGLALLSVLGGKETTDPGRIANRLLEEAKSACSETVVPKTIAVPFTDYVWLCRKDASPRLVGTTSVGPKGLLVTAADARIAGDFREIALTDVHAAWSGAVSASITTNRLVLRELTPWAHASSLPVPLRVVVLASMALSSGALAVLSILSGRSRNRLRAFVAGALGPLVGLWLLRLCERHDVPPYAYFAAPAAAALVAWALPYAFVAKWQRKRPVMPGLPGTTIPPLAP